MADRPHTHSTGAFAVGLMALHDRAFFERLLTDPRAAMADMVRKGSLTLTDAEVDEVVRLLEKSGPLPSAAEGRAMWEHWHQTGKMPVPLWPSLVTWPIRL